MKEEGIPYLEIIHTIHQQLESKLWTHASETYSGKGLELAHRPCHQPAKPMPTLLRLAIVLQPKKKNMSLVKGATAVPPYFPWWEIRA